MRYLSVCSGIESASVAWSALAWSAVAFAEIEPFPCAVLAHHYPQITNLGDVNNFKDWPDAAFDVLVGGTPCQSFSVAGLRDGLADPRGNLALVYLGIADRYRPKWLVWENVPGALSTNDGRDFSAIVGGMVGLGYGVAWRVLDAQHCRSRDFPRAVPQRRRRIVLVGYLGDWRRAAQILFDAESLRGNPAPRRETGKRTSPTITSRTTAGGGLGTDFDCDGGLISSYADIPDIVSQAVSSKWFKGSSGPAGDEVVNLIPVAFQSRYARNDRGAPSEIAYPLTAEAGRTGKGDSAQLVMTVADPICANEQRTYTHEGANNFRLRNVVPSGLKGSAHAKPSEANAGTLLRRVRDSIGEEAFAEWGLGILDTLQPAEILQSALHGSELRSAPFSRRWVVYCALSREEDRSEGAMQSLREARGKRHSPQRQEPSEQFARELGTYLSGLSQPGAQAERFMLDLWTAAEGFGVLRQALSAVQEARQPSCREGEPTRPALAVRRLTVEECEFLQGFPRGYTNVPWRGKATAPDGPRYRAIGNAMATNMMQWIGERIAMVERL